MTFGRAEHIPREHIPIIFYRKWCRGARVWELLRNMCRILLAVGLLLLATQAKAACAALVTVVSSSAHAAIIWAKPRPYSYGGTNIYLKDHMKALLLANHTRRDVNVPQS